MGRPSIGAIHALAISRLSVVERYLIKAQTLPPELYGFVAEIMMLRIFSVLEYTIRETTTRLACGVPYRDGVTPVHIIHYCSSIPNAIDNFKTYNRAKAKSQLQFTNVSQTNDSIKYIIDNSETFRVKLGRYGTQFEEMRKVRNHIAHRTSSTRQGFKDVIRQRYGANVRIKPSAFLVSTKRQPRPIIKEYLTIVKVIINDVTVSC